MERWADIPGHPKHQISDEGRVQNKQTGKVIKPFQDRYGYLRVSLGNEDNVYIHKLVCRAFNGPPNAEDTQINHIDSNRQNNKANNLEWCTASENIKWGVDHGNVNPRKASKAAIEHNRKRVRLCETGQTFDSVKECADFLGVRSTNVSRCLVGSRKGQALHGYHIDYDERS